MKRIIKENPENHEAFVYKYTKLNAKSGEKQFYLGWHLGNSSDEYHHSSTDDDLDLDIAKHDFKYEILHWGTSDEMKTKEYTMLKLADAAKSSEWYNKAVGAPSTVGEIDLLGLYKWAVEINETNSFKGNEPFIKTYSKKTMKVELKREFKKLQIRAEQEIADNTKKIKSWVDKHQGNLKKLWEDEQINLIVVVLEGVEVDGEEVDLIIGGNHTISGTVNSKHGKEIRYLRIPKKDHGLDYKKSKQLASFLNKASKQPGENNKEADILKIAFELCIDYNLNSQSEAVDDCFDLHECDPAQKKRLKTKLSKELKKNRLIGQMFKLYDTDEGKLELEDRKAYLMKQFPNARVFMGSSAGQRIPRDVRDLNNELANGRIYDSVIWLLYHPSPEAEQKWFSDYLPKNLPQIQFNCKYWPKEYRQLKEMTYEYLYMDTMKSDLN